MEHAVSQIKSDILAILNKYNGRCLCTWREHCEECDSSSQKNKLKNEIHKYLDEFTVGSKKGSDEKGNIDKLIKIVLDDAEDKRTSAAFSGEFGDGGASRLEDQVRFYRLGQSGTTPPEWEEKYGHLLDDEWKEYQRLKEKFGGR